MSARSPGHVLRHTLTTVRPHLTQCALLPAVCAAFLRLCVRAPHTARRVVRVICQYFSIWDFVIVAGIYKTAAFLDTLITPANLASLSLNSPWHFAAARFAVWALYAFAAGLPMTGLWVCAHECGHQAFSESKLVNNTVGWFLHSA